MARILVIEPDGDIRRLLGLQLRRLGHEAVVGEFDGLTEETQFDVALIEPAQPHTARCARLLAVRRPELPLVFVSLREPVAETAALRPVAHLVKPVRLSELERALALALRARNAPGC
jgi:CheY-like chemotaxis protein